MSTTGIPEKVDAIRSKINNVDDIDKLRGYALSIVELLVKVDALLVIQEEMTEATEHKANAYQKVGLGLVEMIDGIKNTLEEINMPVLSGIENFDKVLTAAEKVFTS